jgi:hypothetical protein
MILILRLFTFIKSFFTAKKIVEMANVVIEVVPIIEKAKKNMQDEEIQKESIEGAK